MEDAPPFAVFERWAAVQPVREILTLMKLRITLRSRPTVEFHRRAKSLLPRQHRGVTLNRYLCLTIAS